jgi:hypothetical protein
MLQKTFKRALILSAFITSLISTANGQSASVVTVDDISGTWSGESVCVTRHPGCKNEAVVYRFEPVRGNSSLVTLFADKLIKRKREPLYKLEFHYDESRRTLSGESRGHTRGTWQFKVFSDTIEGTAELLERKSVKRRVKVRRVREDQVPAAPNRESYGP